MIEHDWNYFYLNSTSPLKDEAGFVEENGGNITHLMDLKCRATCDRLRSKEAATRSLALCLYLAPQNANFRFFQLIWTLMNHPLQHLHTQDNTNAELTDLLSQTNVHLMSNPVACLAIPA